MKEHITKLLELNYGITILLKDAHPEDSFWCEYVRDTVKQMGDIAEKSRLPGTTYVL